MNSPEAQTKHVYNGDKSAEFADRRNQQGQAFDDNINEHTVASVGLKSDTITEHNVYTSPENAQKRATNPEGVIPSVGSE